MIQLNYRDPRPIYEQVCQQLQRLITTGALQPEEKLPSVRQLASQLAVNPNTMQRAYALLEQAGYIYSVPGKGSFVSGMNEAHDLHRKELETQFQALAQELRNLGLTTQQLQQLIQGGTDV